MSGSQSGCRFCLGNNLLIDKPIFVTDSFYMLGSIDPMLPVAGMIIPRGHSDNPFEMAPDEWAGFADALGRAKAHFADRHPDGFTLGWNVGAVAAQHVFHTHCHIIPRFKGEPNEGVGIRRVLRTPQWPTDA